MFNIIKTPQNYFRRELLHVSNVAFHCSVLPAQYCPCEKETQMAGNTFSSSKEFMDICLFLCLFLFLSAR